MHIPHVKNQKVSVLFVCLGNICRSPAAEGIMKKLVTDNHLEESVFVDSAGTSGWHEGELPDNRMRMHGQRRGYDFCSLSRKFRYDDFELFDYIIVMDDDNYWNVKKLAKTEGDVAKIYRMTDFSDKFSHHQVPDPYYGGASGFELVMDLLEDACGNLLNKIKSNFE
ncbi:Low molecular weight protein-tyrosine-phosphatase YfkJ [bioreactor metagenome]|uniref:Low molecular weight protein-tyrosine-phosphatase YfkJ n=1 Tax=bioreactor metagenome TaxID=1076179 RepID=A0A644YW80_9ZZZZ|nr:MAG: phosphotyrosine protein phosphatase [Bacteroidia bacterium 43-41]